MVKLWCYSNGSEEIFESEFIETDKTYKFVKRPSCFNSIVLKKNVNRFEGSYAFAETKEQLIEIIKNKYNNDINCYEKSIERLKEKIEKIVSTY